MSGRILLSEKHGLNPSIVACPYCGKGKNEIALTGLAGEEWAKKNGHSDGKMPMYVHLEGDIEPCEECKKLGVAMVEVLSEQNKSQTGNKWLVKEDFIRRIIQNNDLLQTVLEKRILLISAETATMIGLHV